MPSARSSMKSTVKWTLGVPDMPGPNETRLNLIDGVEYITLRADDFRTTLRVSDAVHKADRAVNHESIRAAYEEGWRNRDAECQQEIERLRAALAEIMDLELEGGEASLADAIVIADEALHPPPAT